jgi:tetratricopeptide (TPR) repeat protein
MKRAIVLTSIVLFVATSARAADDEVEKARATGLFAEAQALSEAGQLERACAKFEESVELHAGVGNQYHLADCWEKIGRTASAYTMFLKVVEKTRELGQADREKAAAERADALAAKLTRLRVEVKAANDLELTQNGKPIEKESWGKPIPVDPGNVELRASAPGKQPWTEKLNLPDEPGTILVTVPPLEDEKKQVGAAPPPAKQEQTQKKEPAPVENDSGGGFRSVATIGLLGIGTAGVIVGSIMGAQYARTNSDAKDICPAGVGCTEQEIAQHEQLVEDARTARTWTYVGFGAAAVGLGGAAVLYFTGGPSKSERADAPWLRARVFVSGDGVTGALQGGF